MTADKAMEAVEKETEASGKRGHKAHHRSPSYPYINLGEAIAHARAIYQQEKRTPTSAAVIAAHIGFPKLTGPAGRVLSALKQYGLLDDNEGKLRLSDAAFKILMLQDGSVEREELIKKAGLKPQLFKELLNHYKVYYPEDLPSDATLREYLIFQKKFNPTWVDQFIRIFKTTLDLAKPWGDGYTGGELAGDEAPLEVQDMEPIPTQAPQRQSNRQQPPSQPPVLAGFKDFPLYLSPSEKAVLYIPATITRKQYDLLKKQIENSLIIIQETALTGDEEKTDD